jgi:hypothetical protein
LCIPPYETLFLSQLDVGEWAILSML